MKSLVDTNLSKADLFLSKLFMERQMSLAVAIVFIR
jgi:hypothetical protein